MTVRAGWVLDDKSRPRSRYGICRGCGDQKPYTEFSYDRAREKYGCHHTLCRTCDADRRPTSGGAAPAGEPAWVARLEGKIDLLASIDEKLDRLLKALGEEVA